MCYLKQVNEQKLVPKKYKKLLFITENICFKINYVLLFRNNYVKGNFNFIKCIYPQTNNYFL
jgi:hypothetical protein